jgi:hypothetical protein
MEFVRFDAGEILLPKTLRNLSKLPWAVVQRHREGHAFVSFSTSWLGAFVAKPPVRLIFGSVPLCLRGKRKLFAL